MSDALRFEVGDAVRVVRSIRSDGSVAGKEKGDLLVVAGAPGVVQSFGYFLQDQIIYQVYFPQLDRAIGVRDKEVMAASLPWQANPFYRSEQVMLTKHLAHQGARFAGKGDCALILDFERNLTSGALKVQVEVADFWVWLDVAAIAKLPARADEPTLPRRPACGQP